MVDAHVVSNGEGVTTLEFKGAYENFVDAVGTIGAFSRTLPLCIHDAAERLVVIKTIYLSFVQDYIEEFGEVGPELDKYSSEEAIKRLDALNIKSGISPCKD